MPSITIELTKGLEIAFSPFALELHRYLAPRLNAPIETFKTKLVHVSDFLVGESVAVNYARIKIELKKGRDRSLLQECQKKLLEQFIKELESHNRAKECRITVEFSELDPDLLVAKQLFF